MNKLLCTVALALCCLAPSNAVAQQATASNITVKDVTSGAFYADGISGVHPLLDGETFSQLSEDGKRITRSSFKTGEQVGVLFDVATARGDVKLDKIDAYIMSPDERRILLRTETEKVYRRTTRAIYYVYDVATQRFSPLSDGGKQMSPRFSPDGNVVGFARDNNLFVVKLLYGGAETQVTKDGEWNKIINGIPDWVCEEEFSTNCSFDFSADSEMLAWIRYDESRVPVYSMQEYKGLSPELKQYADYPGEYAYKYPIAGAENAKVTVMTYDLKNRTTRTMDVPLDADGYIPRIIFTSDADKLAVVTLNRHQDCMNLYMVNPRSGVAKLALQEKNSKYLRESAYNDLQFYPDGHFIMMSERTGYQHLYWYTLGGKLERTLTSGNYEVIDYYGYNAKEQKFYFASAEESPLRRAVYSVDKAGKKRKLSTETGTNSAIFSTSMKYFMNVYSSATQPDVTTLRDNTGKVLRTLIDNADLKAKGDAVLGQKEFFTFTTADGVQLNGYMVKPRDFDPAKQYPVVMYQYSGPGSQEVKDAWSTGFYPGACLESMWAADGIICAIVDGRGTGARGADFERCTYLNLGDLESHDQVEAAIYLGSLPYVDKQRIAIWGWSFGGFNTLMAMGEGRDVFRCGVAVAAPSSWRYYDSVYTERYMRTPQENPTGYDLNPLSRAKTHHGSLLLIHGTADDNVHYRNCTEEAEALVQADKQFEMQIYTNRNHSIYGGNTRHHLMQRITDFLHRELLGK